MIDFRYLSSEDWQELERRHPGFFDNVRALSLAGELEYLEKHLLQVGIKNMTEYEAGRLLHLRKWRKLQKGDRNR